MQNNISNAKLVINKNFIQSNVTSTISTGVELVRNMKCIVLS